MTPHTLGESIPTTCTITDLCRILQVSRGTLYAHLKAGTFPIPEIQPRIGQPRFAGAMVQAYLDGGSVYIYFNDGGGVFHHDGKKHAGSSGVPGQAVLVNLSGRGDKDVAQMMDILS